MNVLQLLDGIAAQYLATREKSQGKRMAHIKPRWKKPTHPAIRCDECNGELSVMTAYNTGDGWYLSWECEHSCGAMEEPIEDWPFVEDMANSADFEAAGFDVV